MKTNTENIVKNVDTSNIAETELFYIYKDTTYKEFVVFTWATNAYNKYIDKYWNRVDDLLWFQGDIYSRVLWT